MKAESIAPNGQVLLQAGYFINVQPGTNAE